MADPVKHLSLHTSYFIFIPSLLSPISNVTVVNVILHVCIPTFLYLMFFFFQIYLMFVFISNIQVLIDWSEMVFMSYAMLVLFQ